METRTEERPNYDALFAHVEAVMPRVIDAVVGSVRKSFLHPDWPSFIASLNADERAVTAKLLELRAATSPSPEPEPHES